MDIMNNKPLVTIITSTFNVVRAGRKESFRQCVESIHAQTYGNIEHLVIDGASTDGTVELIREYEQKGWLKCVSEPDAGIYDAMNKGVRMARGKYIAFVNSDDFYHDKEGVELSINALEGSGAVFSYAPVINYDEASGVREVLAPDISKIFFSIVPNHQTMFVQRDAMLKEGLFNLDFSDVAEYDLHIRLCLKGGKSVFVVKDFVTYRLGGNSQAASKNGSLFKEVSEIYFRNYNALCPLTRAECKKICGDMFDADYGKVPPKLAIKLKDLKPYFNYEEYLERTRPAVRRMAVLRRMRKMLSQLIPDGRAKRLMKKIALRFIPHD